MQTRKVSIGDQKRSFTNQLQERAKLFQGAEMAPAEAWEQRQKSFPVVIFLDKRRQAGVSTPFSSGVLLLQSWMRGACLVCSLHHPSRPYGAHWAETLAFP